jgi:hypothetical protein
MTTEFEVLQHRRRQVRLWPLDPRWRSSWARGSAQAWNEAKKRHPVGSVTSATVTGVFPANQEDVIRFSDDKFVSWRAYKPKPSGRTGRLNGLQAGSQQPF